MKARNDHFESQLTNQRIFTVNFTKDSKLLLVAESFNIFFRGQEGQMAVAGGGGAGGWWGQEGQMAGVVG